MSTDRGTHRPTEWTTWSLHRRPESVLNRQDYFPHEVALFLAPRPDAEERIDGTGNWDQTGSEAFGTAENGQDGAALVVFVQMPPKEMTSSVVGVRDWWDAMVVCSIMHFKYTYTILSHIPPFISYPVTRHALVFTVLTSPSYFLLSRLNQIHPLP